MRRTATTVVLSVAMTAGACGGPAAERPETTLAIRVAAEGCRPTATIGSGTLLGDGLAVTAAHVVAGADSIEVERPGGDAVPAEIAYLDPIIDIALLSTPLSAPAPDLSTGDSPGEQLRLVGYGAAPDAPASVTIERAATLRIDDIYRESSSRREGWKLDGHLSAGDSGAGLFNDRGELAGIVFAVSRENATSAYALGTRHLQDAIDAAATTDASPAAAVRCPAE